MDQTVVGIHSSSCSSGGFSETAAIEREANLSRYPWLHEVEILKTIFNLLLLQSVNDGSELEKYLLVFGGIFANLFACRRENVCKNQVVTFEKGYVYAEMRSYVHGDLIQYWELIAEKVAISEFSAACLCVASNTYCPPGSDQLWYCGLRDWFPPRIKLVDLAQLCLVYNFYIRTRNWLARLLLAVCYLAYLMYDAAQYQTLNSSPANPVCLSCVGGTPSVATPF